MWIYCWLWPALSSIAAGIQNNLLTYYPIIIFTKKSKISIYSVGTAIGQMIEHFKLANFIKKRRKKMI